jgi:hypothetical protein
LNFADNDRRYVFEVASAQAVPASVNQERAARRALQWAPGFYGARDLDIVDIAFDWFWEAYWKGNGRDVARRFSENA